MADFTPMGAMVKVPQAMSMSDIVNLARGVQAYQQAEQVNPLAVQKAQQEAQTGQINLSVLEQQNRERQNIMGAMGRGEFMTDGRFDIDKYNRLASQIAPTTFSDWGKKLTDLSTSQLGAESSAIDLANKKVLGITGRLTSIINNPLIIASEQNPAAVDKKELSKIINSYANDQANALGIKQDEAQKLIAPYLEVVDQNPGSLRQFLKDKLLSTLDQGSRLTAMQPSGQVVQTGAQGATVQTGQFGPVPMGSPIPGTQFINQLPPGSRMVDTGTRDTNNNPIFNVFDANGQAIGQTTVPAQVAPGQLPGGATQAQPSMPVARMRPGETADTMAAAQKIKVESANAAGQVPMQQFNNNQIISLADDVATGKGAGKLGALSGGYAALPWTSDNASNLNKLGHYMSLQTSTLANSAGLGGTDAGRHLAGEMVGTTEWTPKAIKDTARVNRALSTGTELFNRGVKAELAKQSNDPFAARDFQEKWATTLGNDGIDAIRLYDLSKNKDAQGIKEFVDSLGGQNSKKYQNLLVKLKQMNQLLEGK